MPGLPPIDEMERAFRTRDSSYDGIFFVGVRTTDGPLNIMAMPGAPSIAQLGQLGVARVSLGSALAQAALATTQQAARELLEQGTYGMLEHSLPFGVVNSMFAQS